MLRTHRQQAFFAAVAGLVGLAGGFALAGWTPTYFVIAIDAMVVRATPGFVVNWAIETLGQESHYLHIALSVVLGYLLLSGIAFASIVGSQRVPLPTPVGAVVAAIAIGLVTAALAGTTRSTLAIALSVGAVVAIAELALGPDGRGADDTETDRRRAVGTLAGGIAFAGIALTLGRRTTDDALSVGARPAPERETVLEMVADANDADLDVDGLGPPVSPIESFFSVDINSTPPIVDEDEWTLSITGAVDADQEIEYEELRDRPVEHRHLALRCIGEDLNESLLDTAIWTGTPLTPLLDAAQPHGEYVELRAADGYRTTFSRSFLDDALLTYGMNGQLLPREHGFPVRVLMPGSWGKLNAKWVEEIRILEEPAEGYWEEQGWASEAPITAVAKLWAVNDLGDGHFELGGHAYAGTRGVERVEVSTDGGETWDEAELAEPLPGEDVTRQWRYEYEATETHEVVVRSVDGEGQLQEREESGSFPDGATGWVRQTVEVE